MKSVYLNLVFKLILKISIILLISVGSSLLVSNELLVFSLMLMALMIGVFVAQSSSFFKECQRFGVNIWYDIDNVVYKHKGLVITEDFIVTKNFFFFNTCFRENVSHTHFVHDRLVVIDKEFGRKMSVMIPDEIAEKEIRFFLGAVDSANRDCDELWNEMNPNYTLNVETCFDAKDKVVNKLNETADILNQKLKEAEQNYKNQSEEEKNKTILILMTIGIAVVVMMGVLVLSISNIFIVEDNYSEDYYTDYIEVDDFDQLYEEYSYMYEIEYPESYCDFEVYNGYYDNQIIINNPCGEFAYLEIDFLDDDGDNVLYFSDYLLPYSSYDIVLSGLENATEYEILDSYVYSVEGLDESFFASIDLKMDTSGTVVGLIDLEHFVVEDLINAAEFVRIYSIFNYDYSKTIYFYDEALMDEIYALDEIYAYEALYTVEIDNEERMMYILQDSTVLYEFHY